jgi:hypothetical protein
VVFFALNGIGIAIQTIVLAFSTYTLGLEDALSKNAAVVVGTGIATMFRYWAYKRWVFRPMAKPAPAKASAKATPQPTALPPHTNGAQQPVKAAAHHAKKTSVRS